MTAIQMSSMQYNDVADNLAYQLIKALGGREDCVESLGAALRAYAEALPAYHAKLIRKLDKPEDS